MAFSTIQGSGGAPDSFVGTSGVDTIGIVNSTGNFFLGAQQSADVVNLITSGINDSGVVNGATMKGGQGNDNFTFTASGFTAILASGAFINGNSDADLFTFTGNTLIGSTVQGGQGADVINTGVQQSSTVNGNKDADIVNITGAGTSSSFYGGQGDDTINIGGAAISSVISGDNNNDSINTTAAVSLASSSIYGGQGNDSIDLLTNGAATTGAYIDSGADNDTVAGSGFNDTITAGAGTDSITGNAGADRMTGGDGVDTYLSAVGASLASTATSFAGANVAAGDSLTFGNSLDIIVDFAAGGAGDVLRTGNAGAPTAGIGVAVAAGFAAGTTYFLSGNYNESTGRFGVTAAGTGADTAIIIGTGGALAANTGITLLKGVNSSSIVAANMIA